MLFSSMTYTLQVKVLYVRNLQLSTTEETIENLFKQYAEVERVKKLKDYCFVHFSTREGARLALEKMQGKFQCIRKQ